MLNSRPALTSPAASSRVVGGLLAAGAAPELQAAALPAWQVASLRTYAQETGVNGAHLRAELAARVSSLTGCAIPASAITADLTARRATGALNGVVFQLQGHTLILLRRCAHCGAGHFTSPPIESRSDLGYALAAWMPYHPDCAPADPPDDVSW
ncbi:MAG TPA: hypothetical protein VF808_19035 [Ktedonobacterales bacterium]